MKTSDALNELATALAKAQGEMKNAALNKENPFFKSRYADLASVRDTITPALSNNGLSVVQTLAPENGSLMVCTRLIHSSGQWMESTFPIIADTNKPQAMGSALTYARRYSLAAIVNIATEDDDDANEAQEHGKRAPETRNVAGTPGASKAKAREPFDKLLTEMRQSKTVDALKEWIKLRRKEVEALPEDWLAHFDEQYSLHKDSLNASGLTPLDAG